jgi:hypothetical protein
MKGWSTIATWGLAGFMALNIAGTGYYFYLKQQTVKTREPQVVELGSQFPAFSGVEVGGAKWAAADAPCRVIRVTDDNCAYCKKDQPNYTKVLAAARQASCEVIEVAPRAGSMSVDPRPGVVQLKFVDADIGSVLAPFATPHTVILGRDWTLKWNRRGMMDDKALASGLAAINALVAAKGG